MIVGQCTERRRAVEAQLRERGAAGRELLGIDQYERCQHLRGAVMDEHLAARGQRRRCRPDVAQLDVEDVRGRHALGVREEVSTCDVGDRDAT